MRLIDADALMPNAEFKGKYDVVTALDIANAPTIEMPSAEKTGEWVDSDGLTTSMMYCVYCSECGEWGEYASDYCPNCGAYMREGDA